MFFADKIILILFFDEIFYRRIFTDKVSRTYIPFAGNYSTFGTARNYPTCPPVARQACRPCRPQTMTKRSLCVPSSVRCTTPTPATCKTGSDGNAIVTWNSWGIKGAQDPHLKMSHLRLSNHWATYILDA